MMERVPELELMDDAAQAEAYARADFSEPHNHFVELFKQCFPGPVQGAVLDLGCGPGGHRLPLRTVLFRGARSRCGCRPSDAGSRAGADRKTRS